MFKMLKPRWLTVLTGVAVCALVCAYTTKVSWAAMCMVGYDTSECEGSGGLPKPACDPTKEKCPTPPTPEPDPTCPNRGQTVTTDCQRLGYSERGAKPYPATLWPSKALKNGANDTARWECEPCKNGTSIVYDNACYARYQCYAKCTDEASATNVNGGTGRITGWGKDTVITTGITRKSRAYRDQFVRSQAECDIIFGTKQGANGRLVSERKYYAITRNLCGQCIVSPCDGAALEDGCYEICEHKYTLENGTQCCNKLDKLISMNPYSGDANYWYPYTSPMYHHSGCYDTVKKITAYGDFNNLSESDPNKYCYHQTAMTCEDRCEEPKEDNNCTCGPKSCETLAAETGKTFSSNHNNIVENTVIYHFDNGGVEKINNTCYKKTPVDNCPSTGCYTLSKLKCPNGAPRSDCSCGVGCPDDSIPASQYAANDNSANSYVNGTPVDDDGDQTADIFCLALGSDGETCASESTCYRYNLCSDFGTGLVYDSYTGGCKCGGDWKLLEDQGNCDYDVSANTPKTTNAGFHKHDTVTWVGEDTITCYKFDGVHCDDDFLVRDGSCECVCADGWLSSSQRIEPGDYEDHCIIDDGKSETEVTGYWTDTSNTPRSTTCYDYKYVTCPDGLTPDGCECECPSGTEEGIAPEDTATKTYTQVVNGVQYTMQSGELSEEIYCYSEDDQSCYGGKVLTDEGCMECPAGYSTSSSCPCGQEEDTENVKTYSYNGNVVLTCHTCKAITTEGKTCDKINSEYTSTAPSSKYQIDDNTWCCPKSSSTWYTSITTSEPDGAGSCRTCYQCTNKESDTPPKLSAFSGKSCKEVVESGKYGSACVEPKVEIDTCFYGCEEYYRCANIECPDFTKETCEKAKDSNGTYGTPVTPSVAYCANQGNVFCKFGEGLCRKPTQNFANCATEEDYE